MPGRGVQYLQLRIPERWEDFRGWFLETFLKDVLPNIDVRNAIEGSGISIEGNADVPATIGTGTDVEQLIDGPYVIAEPYTFLANARLLTGENGVIDIEDDGPGQPITVEVIEGGIKNSKIRQGRECSVIGRAANSIGFVSDILAATNNRLLARASDALSFQQAIAAMIAMAATARILARKTSGAGDAEECTLSEVLDFIGSAAQGDILYRGASAWTRLPAGSSGQFLKTLGTGADPAWDNVPGALGSLSSEMLADTPTAFWKLDETSSTFADSGGGGFTLTGSGTFNHAFSVLIPSLPTTEFLQLPTGANSVRATTKLGLTPPFTGDYSIEACFCARAFGANVFRILTMTGSGETEAVNYQIALLVNTDGLLRVFWEHGAGTNDDITTSINLQESKPYHLVAVKDGTANTVTFFVNGIQLAEVAYSNEPSGGTGTLITSIGEDGDAAASGNMIVGYVAFYNGIKLSAARVVAHARSAGLFGV